jgi:hypothetical protein
LAEADLARPTPFAHLLLSNYVVMLAAGKITGDTSGNFPNSNSEDNFLRT